MTSEARYTLMMQIRVLILPSNDLFKHAYSLIVITYTSNEALIRCEKKLYYNDYLSAYHVSVYYINKYILVKF